MSRNKQVMARICRRINEVRDRLGHDKVELPTSLVEVLNMAAGYVIDDKLPDRMDVADLQFTLKENGRLAENHRDECLRQSRFALTNDDERRTIRLSKCYQMWGDLYHYAGLILQLFVLGEKGDIQDLLSECMEYANRLDYNAVLS